ncbi:MAG TPA: hypothetical protein VFX76_05585, partial [Roseiflexaceae bacterium]|nr:hypothetical protein [Roseiflexaceae bacterium]
MLVGRVVEVGGSGALVAVRADVGVSLAAVGCGVEVGAPDPVALVGVAFGVGVDWPAEARVAVGRESFPFDPPELGEAAKAGGAPVPVGVATGVCPLPPFVSGAVGSTVPPVCCGEAGIAEAVLCAAAVAVLANGSISSLAMAVAVACAGAESVGLGGGTGVSVAGTDTTSMPMTAFKLLGLSTATIATTTN